MPPGKILGCQQLVELYYGVRMIAAIKESSFIVEDGDTVQVLQPDPRRIRYEIAFFASAPVGESIAYLGTPQAMDSSTAEVVLSGVVPAGGTLGVYNRIERSFLSDLDLVTLPQMVRSVGFGVDVTVRETFLTPLPTDEESPISSGIGN
jgi:hypothetical protein